MNRYLLAGMLNDYGRALLKSKPSEAAVAFTRAVDITTKAMLEAPSWVELLRERARAYWGLGDVEHAGADWADVRKRSPLNRRYLEARQ